MEIFRNKIYLLLVVSCCGVFCFSGCGKKKEGSGQAETSSAERNKVREQLQEMKLRVKVVLANQGCIGRLCNSDDSQQYRSEVEKLNKEIEQTNSNKISLEDVKKISHRLGELEQSQVDLLSSLCAVCAK